MWIVFTKTTKNLSRLGTFLNDKRNIKQRRQHPKRKQWKKLKQYQRRESSDVSWLKTV